MNNRKYRFIQEYWEEHTCREWEGKFGQRELLSSDTVIMWLLDNPTGSSGLWISLQSRSNWEKGHHMIFPPLEMSTATQEEGHLGEKVPYKEGISVNDLICKLPASNTFTNLGEWVPHSYGAGEEYTIASMFDMIWADAFKIKNVKVFPTVRF